jgi:hypothetical protein
MKMTKCCILLFLFFINLNSYALSPVRIDGDGLVKRFDLSGRDGFDGKSGIDAYSTDCSENIRSAGRDGEDGQNGEKGENGRDAIVFYSDLAALNQISLNQRGGLGGDPGLGGRGSIGCNGGISGLDGEDGKPGRQGDKGQVFLVNKEVDFEAESASRLITLGDLAKKPQTLKKHYWTKNYGARAIFKKNSNISNTFYTYNFTESYKVELVWRSDLLFENYAQTRVAISLVDGELDLQNYRGAILDYKITKVGTTFYLEVVDANSEYELKNLTFGKMRNSGEELTLEIKEKYKPGFSVDTRFIISIYAYDESTRQDHFLGQFALPSYLVRKDFRKYTLSIGKLNFAPEYKRKGVKIKTLFSIYRKARMQTRVLALSGIFRI